MTTYNRREFLDAIGRPAAGAAAFAAISSIGLPKALEAIEGYGGSVADSVTDERFWFDVQQAFTVDRSVINFNNGGVSPAPAIVQEAMVRREALSNTTPAHTLGAIDGKREGVRLRMARSLACTPQEIAFTRNTSEGMVVLQFGIDMKPGDEVLTTNQDYSRMLAAYRQRERRDGIVLKQFPVPVPCEDPDEIVRLFEERITERTRVILMCHMINLTGQILPVRQVVEMARRHDIPVLVDGAHSYAHIDFTFAELGCDYFATSLHKWLCAPHGTGLLYIRQDKIEDIWSLLGDNGRGAGDIRKFEEIGTHPAAPYASIAEAFTFHEGIGGARKEARLRYLRDRWATRLAAHDRVRLHTSLDPRFSAGIGNFEIEGLSPGDVSRDLWRRGRIVSTPINHADFKGLRISPHVYSTLDAIEQFAEAVEQILENGLM